MGLLESILYIVLSLCALKTDHKLGFVTWFTEDFALIFFLQPKADLLTFTKFIQSGVELFILAPDLWRSPNAEEYRKRLAVAVINMMTEMFHKGGRTNLVNRIYAVRRHVSNFLLLKIDKIQTVFNSPR